MAVREREVLSARADLGSASLVCAIVQAKVEPLGYIVCLTGSTLFKREGSDIDIVLVANRAFAASADQVARTLKGALHCEVVLEETTERGIGLKLEYHNLILDIGVVPYARSEEMVDAYARRSLA